MGFILNAGVNSCNIVKSLPTDKSRMCSVDPDSIAGWLKSLLQNHLTAGTSRSSNMHTAECMRGASTQCAAQRTRSGAINVPVHVYSSPKFEVKSILHTAGCLRSEEPRIIGCICMFMVQSRSLIRECQCGRITLTCISHIKGVYYEQPYNKTTKLSIRCGLY